MALDYYLNNLQKLPEDKHGSHEPPHKLCMLLTVIGLAEAGRDTRCTIESAANLNK